MDLESLKDLNEYLLRFDSSMLGGNRNIIPYQWKVMKRKGIPTSISNDWLQLFGITYARIDGILAAYQSSEQLKIASYENKDADFVELLNSMKKDMIQITQDHPSLAKVIKNPQQQRDQDLDWSTKIEPLIQQQAEFRRKYPVPFDQPNPMTIDLLFDLYTEVLLNSDKEENPKRQWLLWAVEDIYNKRPDQEYYYQEDPNVFLQEYLKVTTILSSFDLDHNNLPKSIRIHPSAKKPLEQTIKALEMFQSNMELYFYPGTSTRFPEKWSQADPNLIRVQLNNAYIGESTDPDITQKAASLKLELEKNRPRQLTLPLDSDFDRPDVLPGLEAERNQGK